MAARKAHRIDLGGELGLRDADSLRASLLDAVTRFKSIEIATAGITAIDVSVLQVLIGAHKLAKNRKQQMTLAVAKDGPVCAAMQRAGLLSPGREGLLDIKWHGRDAAS